MGPQVSDASLIIRDWFVDVEMGERRLFFSSRFSPPLANRMLLA